MNLIFAFLKNPANMALFKTMYCVTIAVISFTLFIIAKDKTWEIKFFKRLLLGAFIFKIIACIAIYSSKLPVLSNSDASEAYLPETLKFLQGQISNLNYFSSYSILFHPILAIPVALWHSTGAIVLTMLVFEAAMIFMYLRRCERKNYEHRWRVAFLYYFSPCTFYWVALSGHNGPLISFWIMAALILAEKGKDILSGVCGALAFLTTKLLAILAWPGLVLFDTRKWPKRTMPMVLAIAATAGLALFGINKYEAVEFQFAIDSSGNLWYIISLFFHGFKESFLWKYIPLISFALVFTPMFIAFYIAQRKPDINRFNSTVAFIAATNLVFMVLSRKALTFYMVMMLVFILHTLFLDYRRIIRYVIPITYIGAITTTEMILWHNPAFSENVFSSITGLIFLLMEFLLVGSYIYLGLACFKHAIAIDSYNLTMFKPNVLISKLFEKTA